MIRRVRIKGEHGDIIKDVPLGKGHVRRSSTEHAHIATLTEAIPPRKEHLMFLNKDSAAKHPGVAPSFKAWRRAK